MSLEHIAVSESEKVPLKKKKKVKNTTMCICRRTMKPTKGAWMASPTQWTQFEQALGVGDGQRRLACCRPWSCKESDTTEIELN